MRALADAATDSTTLDPAPHLDELITFAQAASEIPRRRRGKKTAVATLYRWSGQGCRGETLRYLQVGATRCTTRRWICEFFERLTKPGASDAVEASQAQSPALRTPVARRRAAERAERELDRIGI